MRTIIKVALVGCGIFATQPALADEAFMRCARMTDKKAETACYVELFKPKPGDPVYEDNRSLAEIRADQDLRRIQRRFDSIISHACSWNSPC